MYPNYQLNMTVRLSVRSLYRSGAAGHDLGALQDPWSYDELSQLKPCRI